MRERLRAVRRRRDVVRAGAAAAALALAPVLTEALPQAALELALVERELRVRLEDDELGGEVPVATVLCNVLRNKLADELRGVVEVALVEQRLRERAAEGGGGGGRWGRVREEAADGGGKLGGLLGALVELDEALTRLRRGGQFAYGGVVVLLGLHEGRWGVGGRVVVHARARAPTNADAAQRFVGEVVCDGRTHRWWDEAPRRCVHLSASGTP